MEITVNLLAEKFRDYNKAYFKNRLYTPEFKIVHKFSWFGRFSCLKISKKGKPQDPRIEISDFYVFDEDFLRDVLVHEMLHFYLALRHEDIEITHGEAFVRHMENLNKTYGLNIQVEYKKNNLVKSKKMSGIKRFLACIRGY